MCKKNTEQEVGSPSFIIGKRRMERLDLKKEKFNEVSFKSKNLYNKMRVHKVKKLNWLFCNLQLKGTVLFNTFCEYQVSIHLSIQSIRYFRILTRHFILILRFSTDLLKRKKKRHSTITLYLYRKVLGYLVPIYIFSVHCYLYLFSTNFFILL